MSSAYDYLFANWMHSKDAKVRGETVESLGAICYVLPTEKLRDEIRKIIPAFLAFQKKYGWSLQLATGLCGIIEACILLDDDQCRVIEPFLEDIWLSSFPQLHTDDITPGQGHLTNRLQAEMLRCFHITGTLLFVFHG